MDASMLILPSAEQPTLCLLLLRKSSMAFLSGFCRVSVIKGSCVVNGFKMNSSSAAETVLAPVWTPACAVRAAETKTSGSRQAVQRYILDNKMRKDFLFAFEGPESHVYADMMHECDCAVLVDAIKLEEQEWMLQAEDQSKFVELAKKVERRRGGRNEAVRDVFSFVSGLVGNATSLEKEGIGSFHEHESWVSEMDAILNDNEAHYKLSKILVCGNKGAGKSTFLKYALNSLLHVHKAIYVLDCDAGQPEFNVPGMVALHIIKRSMLSPAHLHLKQPLCCYYLGDNSLKGHSETVLPMISALYDRYHAYATAVSEGTTERSDKKNEATKDNMVSSKNMFAALAGPSKKSKKRNKVPPLLINTDGFARYTGLETLHEISRLVCPSKVFHMVSKEGEDLITVVDDKEQAMITPIRLVPDSFLASVVYEENLSETFAYSSSSNSQNNSKKSKASWGVSGKYSTGISVSSAALRHLRVVSCFFRWNNLFKDYIYTRGQAKFVKQREVAASAPPSKELFIHNGSIVDKQMVISMVLTHSINYHFRQPNTEVREAKFDMMTLVCSMVGISKPLVGSATLAPCITTGFGLHMDEQATLKVVLAPFPDRLWPEGGQGVRIHGPMEPPPLFMDSATILTGHYMTSLSTTASKGVNSIKNGGRIIKRKALL